MKRKLNIEWPRRVVIDGVSYYFDHALDETHAEYRTDDDQPTEMVRDQANVVAIA